MMLYGMIDEIIKSKICMFCKHHDGIYCCNPNGYYYGCFRNDYKSCKDFEPKEDRYV